MGMSASKLHLDLKLNRSDQIELEDLPSSQRVEVLNVKERLQACSALPVALEVAGHAPVEIEFLRLPRTVSTLTISPIASAFPAAPGE